ncbi:MAG TPA: hypothetical protein VD978_00670 [Azospirillum sp.]|nr:hypothetical protein [Azospirillum sp.]
MFRILLLTAASVLALTTVARAADTVSPASDVEFRITPFFWASGLSGEVGTRRNLPTVDIDADFQDILRNLDFAAMLAGEYRHDRWGVLADLTYVAVSADGGRDFVVRAPGFTSAEVTSKALNVTATGFYRFYDNGVFSADALAGGRLWSVSADIDLLIAGVRSLSSSTDRTWIDAVAGLRMHANLGNGFGLSAYGDIGGGSSRLTWQLRATLDYSFNKSWAASLGYRHLAVDYRRDGFVFDTTLSGPILGVSYRF